MESSDDELSDVDSGVEIGVAGVVGTGEKGVA
ncbi:hypothetical protein J2S40_003160 [Nocardioides luteus]|nr:hypothetical protein [Nocardioides luteus]